MAAEGSAYAGLIRQIYVSLVASDFLLLQVIYPSQCDKILLEQVFQIASVHAQSVYWVLDCQTQSLNM